MYALFEVGILMARILNRGVLARRAAEKEAEDEESGASSA
jgi:hypothetical protein